MTHIHTRSSRSSPIQRRITPRRLATTFLIAAGSAAVVACQGVEPTAAPASVRLLAAGFDTSTIALFANAVVSDVAENCSE